MKCDYKMTVWLPEINIKLIYLDQYFYSNSFKAKDPRFIEPVKKVSQLSQFQMLVAPFSSVHEEEAHLWRGYGGKNKEELMEFIKITSRGHEFKPTYEIKQEQILKAFQAFLTKNSAEYLLDRSDVLEDNINNWDDYFWIDVCQYIGDIELVRNLKSQAVLQLVNTFKGWRQSTNSFDQDVAIELREAWGGYMEAFITSVKHAADDDVYACLNSPIVSNIVYYMLRNLPPDNPIESNLNRIVQFFNSEHFNQIPYQWLSSRMFAALKDMSPSLFECTFRYLGNKF